MTMNETTRKLYRHYRIGYAMGQKVFLQVYDPEHGERMATIGWGGGRSFHDKTVTVSAAFGTGEYKVNWSAMGPQDGWTARMYSRLIEYGADVADHLDTLDFNASDRLLPVEIEWEEIENHYAGKEIS